MLRGKVLHENWNDYTKTEVIEIQQDICSDCIYFKRFDKKDLGFCDYLCMVGESRNCRPEVCNKKIERDITDEKKKHKIQALPSGSSHSKTYLEV